jgi:hypothetical protein
MSLRRWVKFNPLNLMPEYDTNVFPMGESPKLPTTAKTSFVNLVTSMPPVTITGFVKHFVRKLTS